MTARGRETRAITLALVAVEYRKYSRDFHPFSSPAPGKEYAGTTGRAANIRATSSLSPRTALVFTTALPPRATIWRADPLPRHRAHGIRGNAVEPVALSERGERRRYTLINSRDKFWPY